MRHEIGCRVNSVGDHFGGSLLCRAEGQMTDRQINRDSEQRTTGVSDPQITRCATGYLRPLWLLRALLYMGASLSLSLRRWLRGWLRLSLPLSLRGPVCPKGDQSPPQRRLRAWRFADIPTAPPGQNIGAVLVVTLSIFSASPALDACGTTSALVRQRLPTTSATVIALVLVTPPPQSITGSALASQRFAANRSQAWGSA